MDKAEGVKLLFQISKRPVNAEEEANAEEIVSRLDYLPLGIVTAASSIEINGWSHKEYIEVYNPAEVIQKSKPLKGPEYRYSYSLSTVWDIELKRLKDNPGLWHLLHVLAFFDPDKIHENILLQMVGKDKKLAFKNAYLQSEVQFVRIRAKLTRGGPIVRNERIDDNQLRIHRLFQQRCHLEMTSKERQEAFDFALRLIHLSWPVPERHNRQNSALWEIQQKYVSHILSLKRYYVESQNPDKTENPFPALKTSAVYAELLYNGGWYVF